MFRILIASFTFPPDANGVAHVAYQQARGLREAGYAVEIATGPDARRQGAGYDGFSVTEFAIRGNGRMGNPFRGEISAYQDFLKKYNGDAVLLHAWQSWPVELAIPVLGAMTARTVLVSHGTSYNWREPGWRGWLRWLSYRPYAASFAPKIRQFDRYVFLTNQVDTLRFTDKKYLDEAGLTTGRVIANGASPALSNEPAVTESFRKKYGLPAGKMVLCVSNYQPSKGQRELLRAFRAAAMPDARLVLVGSRFNGFSKLLQREAGADLGQRVFLLENLPQPDIRQAYVEADLFATATYTEAQPLMLLDAMATETAFLAPPVGCIASLPGGLTFASESELTRLLRELLTDDARRRDLARAGRRAVETTYNWPAAIAGYDRLLRELLTIPSPLPA